MACREFVASCGMTLASAREGVRSLSGLASRRCCCWCCCYCRFGRRWVASLRCAAERKRPNATGGMHVVVAKVFPCAALVVAPVVSDSAPPSSHPNSLIPLTHYIITRPKPASSGSSWSCVCETKALPTAAAASERKIIKSSPRSPAPGRRQSPPV